MYKIRLQRDFLKLVANDQSNKRFLLTSKYVPWGCQTPDLQLYIFVKSWKDVYKVRLKRFFLNLQQMTIVIRPSCWHKNFGLNELSVPAQGLCLNFFSSITADFNVSSVLRWAIQDQWCSGFSCPSYLPFWSYASLKKIRMKSCQQNISKTVWATGLKLVQLIGDDK